MSKYKLVLSPKYSFEINLGLPRFRGFRWNPSTSLWHQLLSSLGLAAAVVLVVSPLWLAWREILFESQLLFWMTSSVVVSLSLLLCYMVLTKWQHLVDPPLFLSILVFVLLTILAYLLSPSAAATVLPSQVNTFGRADLKHLSSIALMSFVGMFYMWHVFINTERKLRWLMTASQIFLVSAAVLVLADGSFRELEVLVGLSLPVMLLATFWQPNRYMTVISAVAAVLSGIILFKESATWQTLFVMIATGFIWLWLWLFAEDWRVGKVVKNLISDWRKVVQYKLQISELLRNNSGVLVLLSVLVLMAGTGLWVVSQKVELVKQVNIIATDYRLSSQSLTDLQRSLFGNGGNLGIKRDALMPYILYFQGAFGVLAYLILWLSAWAMVGRSMLGEWRDNAKYKVATVWAPYMFAIPLLALISPVGTLTMWWWWVGLSIISVVHFWPKQLKSFKLVTKLSLRGRDLTRFLPWLQLGLIIFFLAVAAALVVYLNTLARLSIL